MGVLSGLFKSRDKPTNRTNGSAYSFLMGGSSYGRRVNERSAMQMTAVYSFYLKQLQVCHFMYTLEPTQELKKQLSIRYIRCCTMNQIMK